MASYPGPKTKRPSRRKLGRGQHTPRPQVMVTVTGTAETATLTFSVPVVVSGNVNLNLSGSSDPLISQTVTSPTVITQVYTSALAGKTWSVSGSDPSIATHQGGTMASNSGTFS